MAEMDFGGLIDKQHQIQPVLLLKMLGNLRGHHRPFNESLIGPHINMQDEH